MLTVVHACTQVVVEVVHVLNPGIVTDAEVAGLT